MDGETHADQTKMQERLQAIYILIELGIRLNSDELSLVRYAFGIK